MVKEGGAWTLMVTSFNPSYFWLPALSSLNMGCRNACLPAQRPLLTFVLSLCFLSFINFIFQPTKQMVLAKIGSAFPPPSILIVIVVNNDPLVNKEATRALSIIQEVILPSSLVLCLFAVNCIGDPKSEYVYSWWAGVARRKRYMCIAFIHPQGLINAPRNVE